MKAEQKVIEAMNAAEKWWASLTPEQRKRCLEGIERDLERVREKRGKA
jgi:acyl-CoA reductase-like NAD-dependent aldehyde dehydrogenase